MYASDTTVPVDRSQSEIKKILTKYGASAFAFVESSDKAMVQFEMSKRRIKFIIPTLVYGASKDKRGYWLKRNQVDQRNRSMWRAMVLCIKAKLECVESGIATFEQEFMAHILLPNGKTVGEAVIPEIENTYQGGSMPLLMGMK